MHVKCFLQMHSVSACTQIAVCKKILCFSNLFFDNLMIMSGFVFWRDWKHFHFYFILTFSHSRFPFSSSDSSYELEAIKFEFLNCF